MKYRYEHGAGRVRAGLLTSALALFHLVVMPSFAEGGGGFPNSILPTLVAASDAKPPDQASGAVQRIAEIQQLLIDFVNNPSWIFTTAGISLGLYVANQALHFVLKDVPALARDGLILKRLGVPAGVAERFFKELPQNLARYSAAAERYLKEAQALEFRRHQLMEGLEASRLEPEFRSTVVKARKALENLSPLEQMRKVTHDPSIRRHFQQSEAGRTWLARWDEQEKAYFRAETELLAQFSKLKKGVLEVSKATNGASSGWFRAEELRHPPATVNLSVPEKGGIGTLWHRHDSGFPAEVTDPTVLPRMIAPAITSCRSHYAKIGLRREVLRRDLVLKGLVKPTSLAAGMGVAWLSFDSGRQHIKQQYNAEPTEIVQRTKQDETIQAIRQAIEATGPTKMQETISRWRSGPPENAGPQSFEAISKAFREHLPLLAADIRKTMGDKLDPSFDKDLKELQEKPARLEKALEWTLADATTSERIAEAGLLETILLSGPEDAKAVQKERLLSLLGGLFPRYAWPKLALDRAPLPVANTTQSALFKSLKSNLDDVRAEQAKLNARAAAQSQRQQKNVVPLQKQIEPAVQVPDAKPPQAAADGVGQVNGDGNVSLLESIPAGAVAETTSTSDLSKNLKVVGK